MHVEGDEQIGCSIAFVLATVAFGLARRRPDWLGDLANELGRTPVKTDHWALRIGPFCVEVEHILHAGDIFAVDLRNTPCPGAMA